MERRKKGRREEKRKKGRKEKEHAEIEKNLKIFSFSFVS
jgi:hypothetical protein